MPDWKKEKSEEYYRLCGEGKAPNEIAAEMGVKPQVIYDKRRRDIKKKEIQHEREKAEAAKRKADEKGKDKEYDGGSYAEDYTDDKADMGEDILDINKIIGELCETPEPTDHKKSAIKNTIFKLAEKLTEEARQISEERGIVFDSMTIKINPGTQYLRVDGSKESYIVMKNTGENKNG